MKPWRREIPYLIFTVVGLPAGHMAFFFFLWSDSGGRETVAVFSLLLQAILVVGAVPFFLADTRWQGGILPVVAGLLKGWGLLFPGLVFLGVLCCGSAHAEAGKILNGYLYLIALTVLIAGLFELFRGLSRSETGALVATYCGAAVLFGFFHCIGPLLRGPMGRWAARAVLYTYPLSILAGSVFHVDILRSDILYLRYPLATYFPYTYPPAWKIVLGHLLAGGALLALGRLIACLGREGRKGENPRGTSGRAESSSTKGRHEEGSYSVDFP
jgi:hypothetical protein